VTLQESLDEKDVKLAAQTLRAYFMDYPTSDEDVRINNMIAEAPLSKLVDELIKDHNRLKEALACVNSSK
jgi:hypothetical protein